MKIEWTEPAISDLESIRDYIGRDSEYYASRFIGRIIYYSNATTLLLALNDTQNATPLERLQVLTEAICRGVG
jgi:hypothetical protein